MNRAFEEVIIIIDNQLLRVLSAFKLRKLNKTGLEHFQRLIITAPMWNIIR
jgi:hypothetical protein